MAAPDDLSIIIADLDLFTRAEVVALTLNVDANLRESPPLGTPVDTGWARANWVPTVGTPYDSDASKRDPTPSDVAAAEQAVQKGTNQVLSWKPADGALFVTNNVPYIGALDAGHSPQQATPGFVLRAIEQAVKETYSAGASKAARLRRSEAAAGGTTRGTAFARARERRKNR